MQAKSNDDRGHRRLVTGIVALACLVSLAALLVSWSWFDWQGAALFGDSFGSANAILSFSALCLIAFTTWLQIIELGLQRQELNLTRAELKRSADAQADTATAMANQLALVQEQVDMSAVVALARLQRDELLRLRPIIGGLNERGIARSGIANELRRQAHARHRSFAALVDPLVRRARVMEKSHNGVETLTAEDVLVGLDPGRWE